MIRSARSTKITLCIWNPDAVIYLFNNIYITYNNMRVNAAASDSELCSIRVRSTSTSESPESPRPGRRVRPLGQCTQRLEHPREPARRHRVHRRAVQRARTHVAVAAEMRHAPQMTRLRARGGQQQVQYMLKCKVHYICKCLNVNAFRKRRDGS